MAILPVNLTDVENKRKNSTEPDKLTKSSKLLSGNRYMSMPLLIMMATTPDMYRSKQDK